MVPPEVLQSAVDSRRAVVQLGKLRLSSPSRPRSSTEVEDLAASDD